MLDFIKWLWSLFRTIITIILIVILAIVVTQRISNNTMSIAGFRIFTVITESMVPEYKVGDAIFTRTIEPSQIKIGDDVTYMGKEGSFQDKIVTHRVIKIEKDQNGRYTFQTKGIANDEVDPKINETQIYGRVLYKIRSISYLNGVIGNLYGMYFAIFVPFGIIMFIDFVVFRKQEEKEDNDEENDDDDDEDDNDEEVDIVNNKKIDKAKQKRKDKRNKRRAKRNKH